MIIYDQSWTFSAGCKICSKLTIKTPDRRQWRRSGVLIVNFENILHLVFLLLTLNIYLNCRLSIKQQLLNENQHSA